MTFIRTTSAEEADGVVAAMYARQQASWGYVPNYAKVFSHRPEVLERWGRLLAEIKRPMDKRRFELVTFVASLELRNSACSLAHGRKLREFFSDEEIVAMSEEHPSGTLSEADRAMLRFTRQISRDASRVTPAQVDELKAHGFTDAEVFDIAATAAGRAFFTKLLDGLGVAPDSPFLAIEPALREPLTVGRAIDGRASDMMPTTTATPTLTPIATPSS
jgi:uncharacterized peroxidase-related enzyme